MVVPSVLGCVAKFGCVVRESSHTLWFRPATARLIFILLSGFVNSGCWPRCTGRRRRQWRWRCWWWWRGWISIAPWKISVLQLVQRHYETKKVMKRRKLRDEESQQLQKRFYCDGPPHPGWPKTGILNQLQPPATVNWRTHLSASVWRLWVQFHHHIGIGIWARTLVQMPWRIDWSNPYVMSTCGVQFTIYMELLSIKSIQILQSSRGFRHWF